MALKINVGDILELIWQSSSDTGGTIIKGEGIYTNETRKILVCVVRKKQSAALKKIIKDTDPDAFLYINKAKEVNGFGFRSGN